MIKNHRHSLLAGIFSVLLAVPIAQAAPPDPIPHALMTPGPIKPSPFAKTMPSMQEMAKVLDKHLWPLLWIKDISALSEAKQTRAAEQLLEAQRIMSRWLNRMQGYPLTIQQQWDAQDQVDRLAKAQEIQSIKPSLSFSQPNKNRPKTPWFKALRERILVEQAGLTKAVANLSARDVDDYRESKRWLSEITARDIHHFQDILARRLVRDDIAEDTLAWGKIYALRALEAQTLLSLNWQASGKRDWQTTLAANLDTLNDILTTSLDAHKRGKIIVDQAMWAEYYQLRLTVNSFNKRWSQAKALGDKTLMEEAAEQGLRQATSFFNTWQQGKPLPVSARVQKAVDGFFTQKTAAKTN